MTPGSQGSHALGGMPGLGLRAAQPGGPGPEGAPRRRSGRGPGYAAAMTRPPASRPIRPGAAPARAGLTRSQVQRYSRQLLVPEFAEAQERLSAARVLVVGAGGLGCPVISYLAGAGVGALTIADSDTVSLSNLHRQTLYTSADLGRSKAALAAARAQQVNPQVQVATRPHLTPGWAAQLADYTLVIDASDNFETRYLIHDACTAAGREWVWGAAGGTEGMVSVFGPQLGLRDIFPVADGAESCETIGVLGPLLGVVGSMMAAEALKLLTGSGEVLRAQLWTIDLLSARVRTVRLGGAHQRGGSSAL